MQDIVMVKGFGACREEEEESVEFDCREGRGEEGAEENEKALGDCAFE